MDESAYQRWQQLHLRFARGESLTAEERAVYESALREFHQDEQLANDIDSVRQAREAVLALNAEHATLQTQREQLQAEIVTLEAALSERTRQLLGVEERD